MRAREYMYGRVLSRKEASCESACPASRKYGRTKIPHVRREIDEIERVGEGMRQGRFWRHDEGVEEMIEVRSVIE